MHKQEHQTIKVKHKSKGREMQTQDDTKTCYRRENRRTRKQPLCDPLIQNRFSKE